MVNRDSARVDCGPEQAPRLSHPAPLFVELEARHDRIDVLAGAGALQISETTSIRALVEKYKCGLTADEKSPQEIAAAINILLGDSERAHSMGAAARLAFEEEFCYERQFAHVIEAMRELT